VAIRPASKCISAGEGAALQIGVTRRFVQNRTLRRETGLITPLGGVSDAACH
jgi:hypothetical protein